MKPVEKRLQKLFNALSDVDQGAVVAFAEFLHNRQETPASLSPLQIPNNIVRPANESVPAALKRLRITYPMLDGSDLLAEASDLLSQHLMLGRSAYSVIDDMEALFQRHYQLYANNLVGV